MSEEMRLLKDGADLLGVELDEGQLCQFDIYRNELLKWNEKINLISEKSAADIITRHFLDSLSAARFIPEGEPYMLDVGTGAGFPGIPLKIALPGIKLHLLEANRKKISFLKNVIRTLKLDKVQVIHDRTENLLLCEIWRGKFGIVISRAAFKLPHLVRLADYFLESKGLLITLKGPDVQAELDSVLINPDVSKNYSINQHVVDELLIGSARKIIAFQRVR